MATVREVFEKHLPDNIAKDVDKAKEVDAVFQFDITGDGGGTWVIDLTKDADWVTEGASDDAQCTIEVTEEDWLGIMDGSLNAMQAFMMGKLKVSGDMALATRLQTIFSMGS